MPNKTIHNKLPTATKPVRAPDTAPTMKCGTQRKGLAPSNPVSSITGKYGRTGLETQASEPDGYYLLASYKSSVCRDLHSFINRENSKMRGKAGKLRFSNSSRIREALDLGAKWYWTIGGHGKHREMLGVFRVGGVSNSFI
jgi:hypothetical protein